MGLPLVVFGGLFAGLGVLVRGSSGSVPVLNTAFNALLTGNIAEAERLLDQAEARWQLGYVRRVIDLQRANIAMRRGRLDVALARVEAAIARPLGLLTRNQEEGHLAGAQAMRALLRASLGDAEGARADARALAARADAPREALARAAVAEAIVLERTGDRDALAAHLRDKRSLLLEYTVPRERAVVRAFQRMLEAPRTTVYRKSAAREDDPAGDEPTAAEWITQVAPAAAPFARRSRVAKEVAPAPEAPRPTVEPGLLRIAEERVASRVKTQPIHSRARSLVLWLALLVMFVAIWQLLPASSTADSQELAPLTTNAVGAALAAAMTLVVVAAVVATARNLGQDRRLAVAMAALARGDRGAETEVEAMARSRYPATAAQASLELARLAERRGDLETALRRCDEGIQAATRNEAARAMLSSIVLPDLVAERAFVLAASDRADKAAAEMAALGKQFPAFPFMARAELRVGVIQRVRRNDLEGAARFAALATEDLPLSLRDETLVDLVQAVAHPEHAGAGEVEPLRRELRLDPELAQWLRTVAPSVVQAFETSRDTHAEADVAREAEAEAEAAAADDEAVSVAVARNG
jgi:hypothetical protein